MRHQIWKIVVDSSRRCGTMKHREAVQRRDVLLRRLPITGGMLRGSLLLRTVRPLAKAVRAPAVRVIHSGFSLSAIPADAPVSSAYAPNKSPRCVAGWQIIGS